MGQPIDLAEQGAMTLIQQITALHQELQDWRERTQQGKKLEKHQTQVDRIASRLDGFLDATGTPTGASFADNQRIRSRVLGAHRIWDYFRSKLALRDVEWFREELLCADQFAWECYKPSLDAARAANTIAPEALKEPPLVFFSGDSSPFARSRDAPLLPAGITEREIKDFGDAILSLPIPVVGVPWFQVNHLPSAVVIGHEVGHAVENDFGLKPAAETLIAGLGLPADRLDAWLAWSHELFADTYGVLCSGQAAVIALMDYLADEPDVVQKEQLPRWIQDRQGTKPDWTSYPTSYLRMLFNFALLEQLGLPYDDLKQQWIDTYQFHLMQHFEEDVEHVAKALLKTRLAIFGDKSLDSVITFSDEEHRRAKEIIDNLNTFGATPPNGTPFRRIFAALALAYHNDPGRFAMMQAKIKPSIKAKIAEAVPKGVRSSIALDDQQRAALATADRQGGHDLLKFF